MGRPQDDKALSLDTASPTPPRLSSSRLSGHHLYNPPDIALLLNCTLPGVPDNDPPLVGGGLTVTPNPHPQGNRPGDVVVHFAVAGVDSESLPLRVRVASPLRSFSAGATMDKRDPAIRGVASVEAGTRSSAPGTTR